MYDLPSSSLKIAWSPQLLLLTLAMVAWVWSQVKAPLGVSLVAKNCVVSGVPRYWPMSTYFLLFAL